MTAVAFGGAHCSLLARILRARSCIDRPQDEILARNSCEISAGTGLREGTFANSRSCYHDILGFSERLLVTAGIEFPNGPMEPTISRSVGRVHLDTVVLWVGCARQDTYRLDE
jgi:hypothetical protein